MFQDDPGFAGIALQLLRQRFESLRRVADFKRQRCYLSKWTQYGYRAVPIGNVYSNCVHCHFRSLPVKQIYNAQRHLFLLPILSVC